VDFHEIWYAGDDTEGDLDATFLNLVALSLKNGGRLNF
jgi:hypothetical protein